MALSTASLKAVDGLSLTAGGVLSTEAGTEQEILSTHGGVILAAGAGISNAGALSAGRGGLASTSGGGPSNSGTLVRAVGVEGKRVKVRELHEGSGATNK